MRLRTTHTCTERNLGIADDREWVHIGGNLDVTRVTENRLKQKNLIYDVFHANRLLGAGFLVSF